MKDKISRNNEIKNLSQNIKIKKGCRYSDFPGSPLPKYYHYPSGLTSVFE